MVRAVTIRRDDHQERSYAAHKEDFVLIVASAAFLAAQTDPPGRVGRLNYMDGPVSFQPAGVNDWVDATINRPLIPGDNIWVGDRGRTRVTRRIDGLAFGRQTRRSSF